MKPFKTFCSYCGCEFEMYIGHYNRAMKLGNKVYCNRTCAGLGRRDNKSVEEKKAKKSEYDKKYRENNFEKIRLASAEYFKKDYAANPDKYKKERQRRYPAHLKYLQTPEYKKWKKEYDRKRIAKQHYGKFWEAAIALRNLQGIVDNRRAKADQKSINKSQNRKRYANKNTKRKELESCTVGIYQPS